MAVKKHDKKNNKNWNSILCFVGYFSFISISFFLLTIPFVVFGAVIYSRIPTGALITSPVSFSISLDNISDINAQDDCGSSCNWWGISIQDNSWPDRIVIVPACVSVSNLSNTFVATLPNSDYWGVGFALGDTKENCEDYDVQSGGDWVEGDLSDVIFTIMATSGTVTPSDLSALSAEILLARDNVSGATIGDVSGNYTQTSVDTLNAAITAAQAVTNAQAQSVVDAAVTTLTSAVSAFTPIPAPAPAPNTSGGGGPVGLYGTVNVNNQGIQNTQAVAAQTPAFTNAATPQGQVLGVSTFSFNGDLRQGASNDDVRELQTRLTDEGVYTGPITGYFGPLTLKAVIAYQTREGLPQTGFFGSMTRGRLNNAGQVLGVSTSAEREVMIENIRVQIQALLAQIADMQARGVTQ
ncbi:MAG: peptidoglycan-binding protein [Candidatus Zambryskibacteria bacterium]|nr:peptidoglycan-binding protein [Candidatus Zambryskibacteria bacterium]